MKNKFYITTSIAYTNAEPHIGYALELIQADVLNRYHKLKGEETRFLTGTDEHGTKIVRAAEAQGKSPKEFVDEISAKFEALPKAIGVENDDFIRTTDQTRHWPTAQKLWNILQEKGDLYKKEYEGLYCVGHEAFVKKSELVDGMCAVHKTKPEVVKEENWFFKLSSYTQEIKKRIESGEFKILPVSKKNEIINLLDDAEDISFSRPSKDLSWGIPVPNDPSQTMYVWVDALSNYISSLGYDADSDNFKKFWPAEVHLIGKDILRFHAMIWPAILLSAGIELPKAVYVHGFITVDGEKMSKSIGNVIDPFFLAEKYGSDVLRYFLLREIPSDEDGDFSEKKLVDRYNGDLANGLGNLVQRVATLIESGLGGELNFNLKNINSGQVFREEDEMWVAYEKGLSSFRLHDSLNAVWNLIGQANALINERKPWAEVKENPEKFLDTMTSAVEYIFQITKALEPFIPETSKKVADVFGFDVAKPLDGNNLRITKGAGLFPRLEK